ncbi:hypothetical protein LEN26_017504 [Aphanomyces euteiches]|nr:hypothetical protein LEN26_017504 [Aphanomyces euteiches]KAH9111325.1 hypothetical protein AeMF1_014122 [Aphanomyces euteiches]KAH9188580.1 hypothetical protein AeNC1_009438 [Aphanomyces euteiches]
MSTTTICEFNFCTNLAVAGTSKCEFHKHRSQCAIADCYNQVYARNLCARHGGKRKCQFENCTANAQGNAFCTAHGGVASKRFCSAEGCTKQAQSGQRCLKHGGGRRCKVQGCLQYVRSAGLCHGHHTKAMLDTMQVVDPTLCKYAYKKCPNVRATKKDGSLHTLCEYHRSKTNTVQKQYNFKKRRFQPYKVEKSSGHAPKVVSVEPIPYLDSVSSNGDGFVPMMESLDMMDLNVLVFDDPRPDTANGSMILQHFSI